MPFDRPSPTALRDRNAAEIEAAITGADARLRHTVEGCFARLLAMAEHGLGGFLDWIAQQILPDTAEDEILARHAAIWGLNRVAATPASGAATAVGTSGAVVPAGSELRRADGVLFSVDQTVTLNSAGAAVAITAIDPGATGNTAGLTELTFTSPVSGVEATAKVTPDGLAGGGGTEDDASLRARLLARIQEPPHGGAAHDYRAWALEVSGVTRAWPRDQWIHEGAVGVLIVADDEVGGPIPSPALVEAVQTHLDARRPVTAEVFAVAPIPRPIGLEMTIGLDGAADSAVVRSWVEAALADYLDSLGPGDTVRLSQLSEMISAVDGEAWHRITAPSEDISLARAELATLGPIAWAAA